MIISRTPFRISFFGGGTDYPSWYRVHGGAVLATTINKYCYLSCRRLPPFFEHRYRIVYSRMENCQSIDDIAHPIVREILRYLDVSHGLEIHHDADLPARSGLGSSSSFTVGLLHALYGLKGQMPSTHQLATESIYIEQERVQDVVGSQDQVLAAYGGFNHVEFLPSGEISVRPMTLPVERVAELDERLMLFYTGIKRTASEVAQSYAVAPEQKEDELHALSGLVRDGIALLSSGQDIARFGHLLHEAWQIKRSLSTKVSSPYIEDIYAAALSAGAIGGKVIGAGGGGFMLFFAHPGDQPRVRQALHRLIHVPFRFSASGSQVIFYDPEEEYIEEETDRTQREIARFEEAVDLSPDRRYTQHLTGPQP